MSALISDWQAFEAKASELETMAEKYANQGTAFLVDDGTRGEWFTPCTWSINRQKWNKNTN
jgi:hypothetical protein